MKKLCLMDIIHRTIVLQMAKTISTKTASMKKTILLRTTLKSILKMTLKTSLMMKAQMKKSFIVHPLLPLRI